MQRVCNTNFALRLRRISRLWKLRESKARSATGLYYYTTCVGGRKKSKCVPPPPHGTRHIAQKWSQEEKKPIVDQ